MTDFQRLLRQTDLWKNFLIEVEPAYEVEELEWTQCVAPNTSVYWTSFTDGAVSRMTEDGDEYMEAYSLTEAQANAGSFYYDFSNQRLYVHTFGSDDPGTQTITGTYDYTILAFFWRYFTNAQYEDSAVVFPRITEALSNGGFELWDYEPEPIDWVIDENGTSEVKQNRTDAYDGAFCVELAIDAGNNPASVSQSIRLIPSATCQLLLWYKHSGAATSKIQIRDSASNVWLDSDGEWQAIETDIDLSNKSVWTKLLIGFTAHASYTSYTVILVSDSAASASCYFDKGRIYIEREQNPYLAYLTTTGMADLTQSVSPFHESAITMEFGQLQFVNDGWWYEQVQKYYWNMKRAVVRFGVKGGSQDSFEVVFDGMVRYPKISERIVTIDLIDSKALTYTSIPKDHFNIVDYVNLEDGADGLPIPIIYGEFEEVVPTLVNDVTFVFKVACHAVESITSVLKNGELLTAGVDYTVDLTEATITMTADPGKAFVVCTVKGKKCDILDGTYSENVADILYDLLVSYCDVDAEKIDLKSFLDLKDSRSQKHHIIVFTDTAALELVRTLQLSALFHMVPLLGGQIGAFRYTEEVTADTPVFVDEDISEFGIERDEEGTYKGVRLNYGYLPSENHYVIVERDDGDKALWRHGAKNTLEVVTSLRVKAEAEDLADYYVDVLRHPLKLMKGVFPARLFLARPGGKIVVTKVRELADGTSYEVLSSEPYRLLSLQKSLRSGKVQVLAWEDLQSTGGDFCEVCYRCELCNTEQSGACSSCFSCQLCDSGQCESCQSCYYCQLCNTSQCESCQSCDTCQVCNVCESGECASCVTCQNCYTGQCTVCQDCDSCQTCVTCQHEPPIPV